MPRKADVAAVSKHPLLGPRLPLATLRSPGPLLHQAGLGSWELVRSLGHLWPGPKQKPPRAAQDQWPTWTKDPAPTY